MKEGKIRKFDDKEQTNRQTNVSTTESTLILSGYSREVANKQTSVSTTESTLILSGSSLDTRGSWPINKQILHFTPPP